MSSLPLRRRVVVFHSATEAAGAVKIQLPIVLQHRVIAHCTVLHTAVHKRDVSYNLPKRRGSRVKISERYEPERKLLKTKYLLWTGTLYLLQ